MNFQKLLLLTSCCASFLSAWGQEEKIKTCKVRGSIYHTNGYYQKHDINRRFTLFKESRHDMYNLTGFGSDPDILRPMLASDKVEEISFGYQHHASTRHGHCEFSTDVKHEQNIQNPTPGYPADFFDQWDQSYSTITKVANDMTIDRSGDLTVFGWWGADNIGGNIRYGISTQIPSNSGQGQNRKVFTLDLANLYGLNASSENLVAYTRVNQNRIRVIVQMGNFPNGNPRMSIYDYTHQRTFISSVLDVELTDNYLTDGVLIGADYSNSNDDEVALMFRTTSGITIQKMSTSGGNMTKVGNGMSLFGDFISGDLEYQSNNFALAVFERNSTVAPAYGDFRMLRLNDLGNYDHVLGYRDIDMLNSEEHYNGIAGTIALSTTTDNDVVHIRQSYLHYDEDKRDLTEPNGSIEVDKGQSLIRVGAYNLSSRSFTSIKKVEDIYDNHTTNPVNNVALASVGVSDAVIYGSDRIQQLYDYHKTFGADNNAWGLGVRIGFEKTTPFSYTVSTMNQGVTEYVVNDNTEFNNLFNGGNTITVDGDLVLDGGGSGKVFEIYFKNLKFTNDSKLIVRNGAHLRAWFSTFDVVDGETEMKMWEGIEIENELSPQLLLYNCEVNNAMVGVRNHLTVLKSDDPDNTGNGSDVCDGIINASANTCVTIHGTEFNDNYISCYLKRGDGAPASMNSIIQNCTFNFSGNLQDPVEFVQGEERFLAHLCLEDMTDVIHIKSNTFNGDTPETIFAGSGSFMTAKEHLDNSTTGIRSVNSRLVFEDNPDFRNVFNKLTMGINVIENTVDAHIYHARFEDCYVGIDIAGTPTSNSSFTIKNNEFETVGSYPTLKPTIGIYMKGFDTYSYATIQQNTMTNMGLGIWMSGYKYPFIENNTISSDMFGIRIENTYQPHVQDNTINPSNMGGGYGIMTDYSDYCYLVCNQLNDQFTGILSVSSPNHPGWYYKNTMTNNYIGMYFSDVPAFNMGYVDSPMDNKWYNTGLHQILASSTRIESNMERAPAGPPLVNMYVNPSTDPAHLPTQIYTYGVSFSTISTTGSSFFTCGQAAPTIEKLREEAILNMTDLQKVSMLIAKGQFEEAKELNSTIVPANSKEENSVWINDLYLSGFSMEESATNSDELIRLIGLADGCALENGPATYRARIMLSDYDSRYKYFINDCEEGKENVATGMDEHMDISDLKVYPNPAKNTLNMKFVDDEFVGENVHIYDLQGRVVKMVEIREIEQTVDISNLENGNYFFRINGEGQIGRFLKM